MYRAMAVISVAAWEDFNEQLVEKGYGYLRQTAAARARRAEETGSRPASCRRHRRTTSGKTHRAYFGLDPMPSWWFTFAARAREIRHRCGLVALVQRPDSY